MPDPTTTPTPTDDDAQAPQESATPAPGDPTPPEGGQPQDLDLDRESDVAKLRHEAASRRRQLREVEAERDGLREQVDTFHRERVERIAGQRLADASDVWTTVELAELRDADGGLDEARITAAVADVLQRKPHWANQVPPAPDLHQGARPVPPEKPSFGRALRKAAGRRA
jgi:hypothetical protein